MKNCGIWILFIFFIVGCSENSTGPEGPSSEQDVFSLSGIVMNGFGDPISGAQVETDTKTTTTNSSGFYEIIGLLPGTYLLSVTMDGYDSENNNQFIIGSENSEANVALKKVWSISVPMYDAYVHQYRISGEVYYADDNFGTSPILQTGYFCTDNSCTSKFTYLGFDFAALPPNCDVRNAVFSIWREGNESIEINMSQTLGPWSEYGITFNNKPNTQVTSLLPVEMVIPPTQSGLTVDLTAYVASVLHGDQFEYGICLYGNISTFYSRENQAEGRPSLVVDFYY